MRKKNFKKAEAFEKNAPFNIGIAAMSALLLCGVAVGCVTASYISGAAAESLHSIINGYIALGGDAANVKGAFWDVLLNHLKYPTAVFLLGYTVFGIVLIPVVVFLRGFLLSFSVASVVRVFGPKGLFAALSLYGMQALVTIPCVLALSVLGMRISQGFLHSAKGVRQNTLYSTKVIFAVYLICAVILTAAAFADALLIPRLAAWAAEFIVQ